MLSKALFLRRSFNFFWLSYHIKFLSDHFFINPKKTLTKCKHDICDIVDTINENKKWPFFEWKQDTTFIISHHLKHDFQNWKYHSTYDMCDKFNLIMTKQRFHVRPRKKKKLYLRNLQTRPHSYVKSDLPYSSKRFFSSFVFIFIYFCFVLFCLFFNKK